MSDTDTPTVEDVLRSIVPNSQQLNTDDLVATGPQTFTVAAVRRGNKEQPISVDLEGLDRPYKPCKTCRRVLIALWSDDPKQWIGQRMTLYADPAVVYAGIKVGGLRISHASGIDEPKTFLLTATRGKKSEVTIFPLPPAISEGDAAFIEECKGEIERAESAETLKAIGFILKTKPQAVRDAVRTVYAKRQKELGT